jgi:allantoate deiminase
LSLRCHEVESRLDALYALGGGEGANRPGLSTAEEEAHELAASWMAEAGLEIERDPAGNTFGRLRGTDSNLGEVWVGSHLDTVPSGGRLDGALGVVAGIGALERLAELPRARTLAVVAFRDEEGWRFGRGFFGSRAVCGLIEREDLEARDREGTAVSEALRRLGLEPPAPGRATAHLPAFFVETHIEQGPVLAEAGAPLGVVDAITGMAGLRVVFSGPGGHAGTVPLAGRRDALAAAAAYMLALRDAARAEPGAVATVGECAVPGGAANVVPRAVELTIDARAPQRDSLDRLLGKTQRLAPLAAAKEGCEAAVERLYDYDPVPMAPRVRALLCDAVRRVSAEPVELTSGAGHDAGILAAAGVPSGLLFVCSGAGGASHSPAETTDTEAIALSIEVLAITLAKLAGAPYSGESQPARVRDHHNRYDAYGRA